MSFKPLEVRVPITELPTLVEKKSKQTDLNGTPEPMSLPNNDLTFFIDVLISEKNLYNFV